MKIFTTGWIQRKLSDFETRGLAAHLSKHLSFEESVPEQDFIEPAREADIELLQLPTRRVAKMSKKEHIEGFFARGSLRLGTYQDFRASGNPEIQDHQEGIVSLIGLGEAGTAWGTFEGGEDSHIFCTYLGEPDPKVLQAFEYNDCFFIDDPAGFAEAVQGALSAKSYSFGKCVYCEEKALVGQLRQDHQFSRLDHRTIEMVGEAMHFVKPVKYSHQNEFRFTWKMPFRVGSPVLIDCPDAIQFCSRA